MSAASAIFDCFTYNGEADTLAIRTRELQGLVDRQFLIEYHETFSGETKDHAYAWDLTDLPAAIPISIDVNRSFPAGLTPKERENYQRDQLRDMVIRDGGKPTDWVLFGDVDEIPSKAALLDAMGTASDYGKPCGLRMPYHSLLATWALPPERNVWCHAWPVVGTLAMFDAIGPFHAVRDAAEADLPQIARDAGWHLSSMGGPAENLRKVSQFVHYDEDWRDGLDEARLRDLAARGRDIADRFDMDPVPIERLPIALREDPERYARYLTVEAW